MSLRRTPKLCLLLTALALASCQRDVEAETKAEREANATKVTADSTDDATAPIVNEDFQFRLVPPGAGWKLMGESDARSLNPDAIAGAFHTPDGSCGIVLVERLPGTTLEQAVQLLWQEALPGLVVESEVDIEFQGQPAKRRVFSAEIQGQTFYYVTTVFLRQEHLYQLLSWSVKADQLGTRLAFHEAFELIDGEVGGRSATRAAVSEADGVGWRIREGRYESALSGLRLQPPDGWRFLVGGELDQLKSDAEIVVANDAAGVFVALVAERASKSRLEAIAELSRSGFMGGQAPVGEPQTREIAGQRVELRRYQTPPLEYLNGVYVGDDSITALVAWYPQAMQERALASLDLLFAAMQPIPAAERATLVEQLLRESNHQRRFSANRSFRAGELVDFEHQLRWSMPPGFWSVNDFDKALDHSAETIFSASELNLGVHVAIETWQADDDDPAATADALLEDTEVVSRDTVVVDGLTVHRAQSIDRKQSPPVRSSFVITKRDEQMISMMAWSLDDSKAIEAAMQAALDGLDVAPALARTELDGRKYTDLLYGFSFDLPSGYYGEPTIKSLGLGQVASWAKGKEELVTLAMVGVTDNEAWMSSFFEQLLRDAVGTTQKLGKPERSEGTLGGRPARQLTWKVGSMEMHAQIVVADPLLYCVLYVNLSDSQRESVQRSWALLE